MSQVIFFSHCWAATQHSNISTSAMLLCSPLNHAALRKHLDLSWLRQLCCSVFHQLQETNVKTVNTKNKDLYNLKDPVLIIQIKAQSWNVSVAVSAADSLIRWSLAEINVSLCCSCSAARIQSKARTVEGGLSSITGKSTGTAVVSFSYPKYDVNRLHVMTEQNPVSSSVHR